MNATISILDIGHGNAAVIEDLESVAIVDAGPKNGLLEFLLTKGIQDIKNVFLSHTDADHIGGLVNLIGAPEFDIETVWVNTDSAKSSDLKDDLDWLIHESSTKFVTALTPDNVPKFSTGEIEFEILAPSAYLTSRGPGQVDHEGAMISSNTISAVIRLNHKDSPFILFPGDVDQVALKHLIRDGIDIQSQVLVFPHHGGSPGSSKVAEFTKSILTQVRPSRVIFSIGRNKHSNPNPLIVQEIRAFDNKIWIACTQLSKHCSVAAAANQPNYLSGSLSKGQAKKSCCSGTITYSLPSRSVIPSRDQHQDFIQQEVPSPICHDNSSLLSSD